jgi:asparagine synthase (glutamine-hydrolysing)
VCGIAGFTAPGPEARRVLTSMNAALSHRGPDGSGLFVDRDIGLAHTRLAIIDLAGGVQPRVDASTGDALVFNGEVYGYRHLANELRADGIAFRDDSDTEVLFQLIRRDGVSRTLARIDGMFAFAFRHGATGAVTLARDRFGEKPLYYGTSSGGLVFASEVSAMRCHPAYRNVAPDRHAAYAFLIFEYAPGDASGWQGIAKLEPASVLTFYEGRCSIERYWRPPIARDRHRTADPHEVVERLDALLSDSVRRRLVADVPVGVLLSGGVDSSLVTALAARASPAVTAFSVRVGGQGFDETPHAITVANHLGVRHQIVELGESDLVDAFDVVCAKLGEPLADSSLLPTYLVCRAARQSMTVALGGDGADELFAGYPNFAVQRFAPVLRRLPAAVGQFVERATGALSGRSGYMNWRFMVSQLSHGFGAEIDRQSFWWMAPFSPAGIAGLWRQEAVPEGSLAGAFAPVEAYGAEAADLSPVDKLLYLFLLTYLADDILAKTDRASMFNGLEIRTPFLDHRFAEYACALPASFKLKGRTRKYILKQLARRYLPDAIVDRKKHGFALPIGGLIRTLFWERCSDVLLSRSNPAADWFDRDVVESLLAEHRTGRRDHGKKLWTLFILFSVAGSCRPSVVAAPALAAAQ